MKQGDIYWDEKRKQVVEFQYMGQTGLAIVCEPGDSGGVMQSCWGIDPRNLVCTKCHDHVATEEEISIALDADEEKEEEQSLDEAAK